MRTREAGLRGAKLRPAAAFSRPKFKISCGIKRQARSRRLSRSVWCRARSVRTGSPQPLGCGLALRLKSTSKGSAGRSLPRRRPAAPWRRWRTSAGCAPKTLFVAACVVSSSVAQRPAARSRPRAEGCILALLESRPVRSAAGRLRVSSRQRKTPNPAPRSSVPQSCVRVGKEKKRPLPKERPFE